MFTAENGKNIYMEPGDIVFVPISSRYISKWQGTPDIFYISMHFSFEPTNLFWENQRFKLQKITLPNFVSLKEKFSLALSHYNSDEVSQLTALGVFYEILSHILPKLHQKTEKIIDERIERAMEYINSHSEQRVSVPELAALSNMSIPNFHAQFKKYTNQTPIEYKNHVSIVRAMRLLKEDEVLSVEQISEMLGFGSTTYFNRLFKKTTGETPVEYRKSKMEL